MCPDLAAVPVPVCRAVRLVRGLRHAHSRDRLPRVSNALGLLTQCGYSRTKPDDACTLSFVGKLPTLESDK